MKMLTMILYLILALMVVGCSGNTNEESTIDFSENSSVLQSSEQETTELDESSSISVTEESDTDNANNISSEQSINMDSSSTSSENSDVKVDDKEDKETLSQYSTEQIEYARVWLQLGPNQEIDGLYVRHIPAGMPLDPNHDTGVVYPEDVIQLTGGRLVDGIITYSGNGDGTINVYNVPRRWYGGFSPPDDLDETKIIEQMEEIIQHTELVYIDPGDDEAVIKLIKLLHVQQ